MNETKVSKRNEDGITKETLLGTAWVHLMGALFAYYFVYQSTLFSPVTNLVLGTLALVLAPFLAIVPADILLRYKSKKLALAHGAAPGVVFPRSQIGVHADGQMVVFTPSEMMYSSVRKGRFATGEIKKLPMVDDLKKLQQQVQQHLEFSGLLVSFSKIWNILLIILHLVLLSTTSLHEQFPQLDSIEFFFVMTVWLMVSLALRTSFLQLFMMKGQLIAYLREDSFENGEFAMADFDSYNLAELYLDNQKLLGTIKAVMLDGSFLLEVTKNNVIMGYVLVNRK